jgi:hypothetical protein
VRPLAHNRWSLARATRSNSIIILAYSNPDIWPSSAGTSLTVIFGAHGTLWAFVSTIPHVLESIYDTYDIRVTIKKGELLLDEIGAYINQDVICTKYRKISV